MTAELILFDVNQTLSDTSPLAQRFAEIGAPAAMAEGWFTAVLRDGFALVSHGESASFADVAEHQLRAHLAPLPLDRDLDAAVEHVMTAFQTLDVHTDVAPGIRALAGHGLRLATLSNGAVSVAEQLLQRARLRDAFEALLSVEAAGVWKPASGAYAYALRELGVAPEVTMLVAVHPWDVDGARRAGLQAAWIDRRGVDYPSYFRPPTVQARSLPELAEVLR